MKDLRYTLIRSSRKTVAIQIRSGYITVRAPLKMQKSAIDDFVQKHEKWLIRHLEKNNKLNSELENVTVLSDSELKGLKNKAENYIPQRVEHYANRLNVNYGKISFRFQKTRWGSCSSSGNLNFNCLLMLAPTDVIDAIIAHELCHRKHMNHSKDFYEELLRICPNYEYCNTYLKEHGAAIMRKGGK